MDRDFFGVSDPYCTISRPEPSGGFRKIRTSETKMNTLNPSWNDFLFNEDELNGADKELKLMIQVYDDDGKRGPDGKDQLIGSGFFSLRELEAAAMVKSTLPLSDGKKSKPAGYLVVRSFREHGYGGGPGAGNSNYGAYPGQTGGLPQQGVGYPSQGAGGYPGSGYPGQGGYPGAGGGYPGYPGAGGAPQGPGGYPGAGAGFPGQAGGP